MKILILLLSVVLLLSCETTPHNHSYQLPNGQKWEVVGIYRKTDMNVSILINNEEVFSDYIGNTIKKEYQGYYLNLKCSSPGDSVIENSIITVLSLGAADRHKCMLFVDDEIAVNFNF